MISLVNIAGKDAGSASGRVAILALAMVESTNNHE